MITLTSADCPARRASREYNFLSLAGSNTLLRRRCMKGGDLHDGAHEPARAPTETPNVGIGVC